MINTYPPETLKKGIARDAFTQLNSAELVYFDNASTALKPDHVINAVENAMRNISNVGRSKHKYSESTTAEFERSRERVSIFLNCSPLEILFTQNCTDSINLVCHGLRLHKHDRVILSTLEHHANLIPWLEHANVEFVRLDTNGFVDLNHLQDLLSTPAKLVAVCQVSNITGNIQPVSTICRLARAHGALSLVDAAQAVGHIPVDVKELSCDFLAFSAHKAFGPSGVGGLYIRQDSQHLVKNFRYGGGMVDQLSTDKILYKKGLARFEAGTPNIEGVIGTGAAFDFITKISLPMIEQHNKYLDNYALEHLKKIDYLTFPFNPSANRVPIITFNIEKNINMQLFASILSDNYGIAINSGFQCNQKLYRDAGLQGGIRVSLHMYNTTKEIDKLIFAMAEIFG